MNINEQLNALYKSISPSIFEALDIYRKQLNKKISVYKEKNQIAEAKESEKKWPGFPFFIKAPQSYESADIKLMIFGQESNNFAPHKKDGKGYISYDSQTLIEDIACEYDCVFSKVYKTDTHYFWKGVRTFINMLKKKNENLKIDFIWNNLIKMEYSGEMNFPKDLYEPIIAPYLNEIIPKEIKILKPDYVVFFTGNTDDYEKALSDIFQIDEKSKEAIEGFDKNKICALSLPNIRKSFRTYHPNYLKRSGLEKSIFEKISDIISADIKQRQ